MDVLLPSEGTDMAGISVGREISPISVALCSLLALLTCRIDICLAAEEQTDQASQPRDVVVIAAKRYDKHTLEHDIVPRFVQSHGAPSIVIDQVSRWRDRVCPQTTGLQLAPAQFVSRRILSVARSVGAPSYDSRLTRFRKR
jgi:hypothetical protein